MASRTWVRLAVFHEKRGKCGKQLTHIKCFGYNTKWSYFEMCETKDAEFPQKGIWKIWILHIYWRC